MKGTPFHAVFFQLTAYCGQQLGTPQVLGPPSLFTHIDDLPDPGYQLGIFIPQFQQELRQVFIAILGMALDRCQVLIRNLYHGHYFLLAGFYKFNLGGLVPDHIILAQQAHQEKH